MIIVLLVVMIIILLLITFERFIQARLLEILSQVIIIPFILNGCCYAHLKHMNSESSSLAAWMTLFTNYDWQSQDSNSDQPDFKALAFHLDNLDSFSKKDKVYNEEFTLYCDNL